MTYERFGKDGLLPAVSNCVATRNLSGALCEEGIASSAAQLGGETDPSPLLYHNITGCQGLFFVSAKREIANQNDEQNTKHVLSPTDIKTHLGTVVKSGGLLGVYLRRNQVGCMIDLV